MKERDIEIRTGDGSITTFVVHPDDGRAHPVVLFLMDAPGKRPLLHAMARIIAERGYYVMLPNLSTGPPRHSSSTSRVQNRMRA